MPHRNSWMCQAATGVAEMCVRQMVDEGLTEKEACANIYMIDIDGLLTKSRAVNLSERHLRFAKVTCCWRDGRSCASTTCWAFENSVSFRIYRRRRACLKWWRPWNLLALLVGYAVLCNTGQTKDSTKVTPREPCVFWVKSSAKYYAKIPASDR